MIRWRGGLFYWHAIVPEFSGEPTVRFLPQDPRRNLLSSACPTLPAGVAAHHASTVVIVLFVYRNSRICNHSCKLDQHRDKQPENDKKKKKTRRRLCPSPRAHLSENVPDMDESRRSPEIILRSNCSTGREECDGRRGGRLIGADADFARCPACGGGWDCFGAAQGMRVSFFFFFWLDDLVSWLACTTAHYPSRWRKSPFLRFFFRPS